MRAGSPSGGHKASPSLDKRSLESERGLGCPRSRLCHVHCPTPSTQRTVGSQPVFLTEDHMAWPVV